ncbi:MAG: hypothetical protein ABI680_14280, partial [Chthoniobacteraceae bacterium]
SWLLKRYQIPDLDAARLAHRASDAKIDFLQRFIRSEPVEAFDIDRETGRIQFPMELEDSEIAFRQHGSQSGVGFWCITIHMVTIPR